MKGILSAIIFIPLIGIIILALIPKNNDRLIKWTALIFSIIPFVLSILLYIHYDPTGSRIQFVEKFTWIKQLGMQYYLGVDGLSIPLVILSTLTMVISILYSFVISKRTKEYFILMLAMTTAMVGVFMSLDYILFYIFWEIGLIPMYFLIGIWGGRRREYAAIKFFLYTFFGSVFMLLGILGLYFYAPAADRTFDMIALAQNSYPIKIQIWVFLSIFLGLAIKLPSFPFHTWLPDAHVEAPTAASVILAAVLLKMGGYGFGRILMPSVPDAFEQFVPLMAVMGAISIVYGAYLAMAQDDLKKMVAYSSISHMGFVMLGFASLNADGVNGAIFQMISHGLVTGLMFIIVGMIHDRYHTRKISELDNLMNHAPVLSSVVVFTTMASLGMPMLSGFIGEWLSIAGVFQAMGGFYAILMVVGIILTAGYFVYMLARIFLRERRKEKVTKVADLSVREMVVAFPMVALILFFGVYPKPVLDMAQTVISTMIK